MQQSRQSRSPWAAALFGGFLLLPFVAANAIVANRIEPFFSFIRPGFNTSPFEYGLLAVVLGCMPVGAYIASRPLFEKSAHPKGRIYLVNGVVALFMLVAFVILAATLADEIYRCDVLRIPNCD